MSKSTATNPQWGGTDSKSGARLERVAENSEPAHKSIRARAEIQSLGLQRRWSHDFEAVLMVALAIGIRQTMVIFSGPPAPYLIFFPAVIVAAWRGGTGPALLTTALSAAWEISLVLPSGLRHVNDVIGAVLFVGTGITIAAMARRQTAVEGASRSARYARTLIEASLDPLVTISPEGRITDVNYATELMTGRTHEALIGTEFCSYFTEPEKAHAGYEQALARGQVTDYPLSIRHASGKITDVLYNAAVYRDEAGGIAGVFAAARDVTERKRAEKALRASEEHYRGFIERSAAGVVRSTLDDRILSCNDAFLKMVGYESKSELLNQPASRLYMNSQDRAVLLRQLKQSPFIQNHEICLRRKDGAPVWVLCSISPIEDVEGTVLESTNIDVTARKQAESELAQYQHHLEELVASRTQALESSNRLLADSNTELETFAYSVSHDLRAPLRAMDGFARILLEEYAAKLDDEGQRMLRLVRNGSKKLAQLIDDILAFSRAGRQEMACARVDMNEGMHAAREQLEPALAGRGITWDIQPLPPARGDARMLECVWLNLLDNAVKFTARRAQATIRVGARIEAEEIVYFVRDNGVGFDMRYAGKLFGLFQRLQGDEFEGTGIGLAVVQRIIGRHGGRVWAEGAIDQGAAFYFSLPREESTHERSHSTRP